MRSEPEIRKAYDVSCEVLWMCEGRRQSLNPGKTGIERIMHAVFNMPQPRNDPEYLKHLEIAGVLQWVLGMDDSPEVEKDYPNVIKEMLAKYGK